MTQAEDLRAVLDVLEATGVAYMIVGSFSSSLWGLPRATNDADVVVQISSSQLDAVVLALGDGYYVPLGIARDVLERGGMFNLVHAESGSKIDLIVAPAHGHHGRAFARRLQVPFAGRPACFASPEDTLLGKLVWLKQGGGEQHLRDCAGIVRVQAARLDRDYLRAEAQELGVVELLESVLADLGSGR